jgi:DNA (cytosine-5)-methyltransferase 1
MIKIGTDFSGIGAPEQALKKLGVEHKCMFACDVDKYAKKSYLANYNPEVFYDDIKTRDHKNAPYVDLYVAGFPCQAFSIAGRRKGFEDTRGTLFFDLLQYLKEKKPKYFILENVKGLLSHDKGQTFNVIIDSLAKSVNKKIRGGLFSENQGENLGYHIYHKVLNTKNFGIPQNRERIFIVGFREDKHSFKFPKEIPLEVKLKDVLQNEVDEKFYLSEHSVKKLEEYNKRNKEKGNGFRAKFHDTEKDMMSSLKVGGQAADDLIEIKGAALRTHPRTSNPDKDKKEGRSKRLEVRKDGLANSITTHHLDSIVVKDNVDWVADFRNDEGLRKRKDKIAPCLSFCIF